MEHVDGSSSDEEEEGDAEELLHELCAQLGIPYSPGRLEPFSK